MAYNDKTGIIFNSFDSNGNKYKNKLLSMTHEINSYYTELCFYDYLSKQYPHDIELCFKNFDIFFFDFSEYLELLFNSTKTYIFSCF